MLSFAFNAFLVINKTSDMLSKCIRASTCQELYVVTNVEGAGCHNKTVGVGYHIAL